MGRPNVLQLTILLASICCTRVIISSPVPVPFPDPDPAVPLLQGGGVADQPQQDMTTSGEGESGWNSRESSTRTGLNHNNGNGRSRTGLWYRGQSQQNPVVADLYSHSQGQGQILNRAFPYNLTGESLGVGSSQSQIQSQSHSHSHHAHHHQHQRGVGSSIGSGSGNSGSGIPNSQSAYQASEEHVAAWREVRKRSGIGASRSDRNLNGLRTNTIQKRNTNSTMAKNMNGTGTGVGGDTSDSNHTTVRSPSSSTLSPLNSTSMSTARNTNSSLNSTLNPRIKTRNENETCTLEPAFLCLMDLDHFQRDKDRRLIAIKEYVMHQLGFTTRNPSKPAPSVDKTFIQQFTPSSPFSGQLQTLYASCDIPSNVDEDTWNSPDNFNLYFNIPSSMLVPIELNVNTALGTSPFNTVDEDSNESLRSFHAMIRASSNRQGPRPIGPITGDIPESLAATIGQLQQQRQQQQLQQQATSQNRNSGITSNVISAKLKLYKIGRGDDAEIPKYEQSKPSEPCNQTETEQVSGLVAGDQISGSGIPVARNLSPSTSNEERIRVSVYWYTVPVKKHHYKKKLLDTKMISVKESKWVEFDIRNAAMMSAWLERRENNGLIIQVENEDNDWLDARHYFAGLPCAEIKGDQSADVNSTVQNTNVTSAPATQNQPELSSEILPPPVLEICTLSIPSAPIITTTLPLIPKQPQNRILVTDPRVRAHIQQNQNSNQNVHKHRHNHGERRHRNNSSNRSQSQKHSQEAPIRSSNQSSSSMQTEPTNINLNTPSGTQQQQSSSQIAGLDSTTETTINRKTNQNQSNNNDNDKFSLDEDHPLRDILATVASSHGGSSESRQRNGQSTSASTLEIQGSVQAQSIGTATDKQGQGQVEQDYYNDEDDYEEPSEAISQDGNSHVNVRRNRNTDDGQSDHDDVIIQKIYISPPARHETPSNSRSRRHHRPSRSQGQLQSDFEPVEII